MVTREQPSEDIFETLNPTLHQYFDLASQTLEAPQPILDDIIANEERYEQGVLINQGGMKKILKITDALTGRPVAMGQLHDPENPQKVERFLREARLTAALEHPNIIPVYDIGVTAEGDPFFTMKLVGGRSLSKILKALGDKDSKDQFSYQDLMNIFIKICDAMAYAHSKGILHLDLKPENIRVGDLGEVLVCDWGLAKVIDSPDEEIDVELDPCLYNDITLDGVI
ncbi:MAG: serine/threonine protein kinase, partial [Lentisphaeraceae bacterium]|nr:serine/threonine protein kinase [Lentisphaeraceae bacterium]